MTKPGSKSAPKTFNHALSRAALSSAHVLDTSDPLATALEKYALASEQVGDARLQQDAQIASRFNAAFTTTLNTNINFAQKARKTVENARFTLDAAKSKAKNGGLGFPPLAGARKDASGLDDEHITEDQRVEIEEAEDEFVGCTEEAVGVMKNVLDTPEPLRNLADLVQAQLEFHKKAFEIYSELAPLIDSLQVEQEVFLPTPRFPVLFGLLLAVISLIRLWLADVRGKNKINKNERPGGARNLQHESLTDDDCCRLAIGNPERKGHEGSEGVEVLCFL